MQCTKKILILGGSSEGFAIANALQELPGVESITSFAGRTSLPRKPAGPYRTGGFGGVKGLANYIHSNAIDFIIDATHPFAERISENAAQAAIASNRPIIHFWREPWQHQAGDEWIEVDTVQQAAESLTPEQSPCFLTIGRLELNAFREITDIAFYARTIEPAKADDPNYEEQREWPENFKFIYAKGPFTKEAERELFLKHNIRSIVTKNSGGDKASAKLDIARELKCPVIIINRPPPPKGKTVKTANEAINWLKTEMELA